MHLTVPPDVEALVQKRLATGAFANAEEVIRRALEALDAEESWTDEERLRRDIEQLRAAYVFADESVTCFLSEHRAFPGVLREAVEPLKKFFGPDKVFRLEVSSDEDELRALYVVVRWTGSAEDAAAAIDRFDDGWWLEHMTPAVSNLSFTCDFA